MHKPTFNVREMTAKTVVTTHALGIQAKSSTRRASTATKAKLAGPAIKAHDHFIDAKGQALSAQERRVMERQLAASEAETASLRKRLSKDMIIDVG